VIPRRVLELKLKGKGSMEQPKRKLVQPASRRHQEEVLELAGDREGKIIRR
jgi:hypothetical protein